MIKIFIVLTLIGLSFQSATFCNSSTMFFELDSFGYFCFDNNWGNRVDNIVSETKVLSKVGSNYVYRYIKDLNVGDIVYSPDGDTTITSFTQLPSTINPRCINSELRLGARNDPQYRQISTWLCLDGNTVLPVLVSNNQISQTITYDNNTTIYTTNAYYDSYIVNNLAESAALNRFNPLRIVSRGQSYCNDTLRDIYYYDTQSLLGTTFRTSFGENRLTGDLDEFFEMVSYIINTLGGIAFINDVFVYDYFYTINSCVAYEITTANGYIVVNDILFRT